MKPKRRTVKKAKSLTEFDRGSLAKDKIPGYFADDQLPLREIARLAAADVRSLQDRDTDCLNRFDEALDLVAPRLVELVRSADKEEQRRGMRAVERFQRLRLEARRLDVEFVLRVVEAVKDERVERLRKETTIEAAKAGLAPDGTLTTASMPQLLQNAVQIVMGSVEAPKRLASQGEAS